MREYETISNEDIGKRMRMAMDAREGWNEVEALMKEIKPKKKAPRIATINTSEDLKTARERFELICTDCWCSDCKYRAGKFYSPNRDACFDNYLDEEIEVDE